MAEWIEDGFQESTTNKPYIAEVTETSSGDQIIIIPPELLEQLNWKVGDEIQWNLMADLSLTLIKVEK